MFGWKKDRYDKRDLVLVPALQEKDLPSSVDLSAGGRLLPVRNQGNEGSCVGFAMAALLAAQANLRLAGAWQTPLGPRWIYNGARFLEGTLDQEGTYPRSALEWLRASGSLLEELWPYQPGIDSHKPPPTSLKDEALKLPIVKYSRIDNGLKGLCLALAQGDCVAVGAPWFDEWMRTDQNGVLPTPGPTSNVAGGHEFLVYGYCDYPNGVLLARNSWGEDWGDRGDFKIPMASVKTWKDTYGYDAHKLDVNWSMITDGGLRFRLQKSADGTIWQTLWEDTITQEGKI